MCISIDRARGCLPRGSSARIDSGRAPRTTTHAVEVGGSKSGFQAESSESSLAFRDLSAGYALGKRPFLRLHPAVVSKRPQRDRHFHGLPTRCGKGSKSPQQVAGPHAGAIARKGARAGRGAWRSHSSLPTAQPAAREGGVPGARHRPHRPPLTLPRPPERLLGQERLLSLENLGERNRSPCPRQPPGHGQRLSTPHPRSSASSPSDGTSFGLHASGAHLLA